MFWNMPGVRRACIPSATAVRTIGNKHFDSECVRRGGKVEKAREEERQTERNSMPDAALRADGVQRKRLAKQPVPYAGVRGVIKPMPDSRLCTFRVIVSCVQCVLLCSGVRSRKACQAQHHC